jgi:hypothetical protein
MKMRSKLSVALIIPHMLLAMEEKDVNSLFSKNLYETSSASEQDQVKEVLNRGNVEQFLDKQNELSLLLNANDFQKDSRVKLLIEALGRTYNAADVQEQYTFLKDLINNDGIRKLGYQNIEELENGLYGSQNEAKSEQIGTKIEHERERVVNQAKNVGKKIGEKLGL